MSFTRRQLLRAGFAGLASLSLPDILRLQAAAPQARRDTSVIFLFQEGGATQFETYDPKPDIPSEMRGEFKPIATSVPGVHFSEMMAQQAKLMHKLTLLRGIHHPSTQHSSSVHLAKTGYYCRAESNVNEMPSIGSHVSRMRGPVTPGLPPYVVVHVGLRYDSGHFIGSGYDPFLVQTPEGETRFRLPNLTLLEGVTLDRLDDRQTLLGRVCDRSPVSAPRHRPRNDGQRSGWPAACAAADSRSDSRTSMRANGHLGRVLKDLDHNRSQRDRITGGKLSVRVDPEREPKAVQLVLHRAGGADSSADVGWGAYGRRQFPQRSRQGRAPRTEIRGRVCVAHAQCNETNSRIMDER